jgi:uncharacterized RDD family membrane protein YckC
MSMNEAIAAPKRVARPAHLGWRLLALCYDVVVVAALLMLTSLLFLWLNGGHTVETRPWLALLEFIALWTVTGLYAVVSWRRGGQTIGMRPWRLKVVANDGRLASRGALCLRYAVATLTPGLCLLWSLFDSERRGLHDLASGTLMVRMDA